MGSHSVVAPDVMQKTPFLHTMPKPFMQKVVLQDAERLSGTGLQSTTAQIVQKLKFPPGFRPLLCSCKQAMGMLHSEES